MVIIHLIRYNSRTGKVNFLFRPIILYEQCNVSSYKAVYFLSIFFAEETTTKTPPTTTSGKHFIVIDYFYLSFLFL